MYMIPNKFQHRTALLDNWATDNPLLMDGELGFEVDTYKIKIGDGSNNWNDLLYIGGGISSNIAGWREEAIVPDNCTATGDPNTYLICHNNTNITVNNYSRVIVGNNSVLNISNESSLITNYNNNVKMLNNCNIISHGNNISSNNSYFIGAPQYIPYYNNIICDNSILKCNNSVKCLGTSYSRISFNSGLYNNSSILMGNDCELDANGSFGGNYILGENSSIISIQNTTSTFKTYLMISNNFVANISRMADCYVCLGHNSNIKINSGYQVYLLGLNNEIIESNVNINYCICGDSCTFNDDSGGGLGILGNKILCGSNCTVNFNSWYKSVCARDNLTLNCTLPQFTYVYAMDGFTMSGSNGISIISRDGANVTNFTSNDLRFRNDCYIHSNNYGTVISGDNSYIRFDNATTGFIIVGNDSVAILNSYGTRISGGYNTSFTLISGLITNIYNTGQTVQFSDGSTGVFEQNKLYGTSNAKLVKL